MRHALPLKPREREKINNYYSNNVTTSHIETGESAYKALTQMLNVQAHAAGDIQINCSKMIKPVPSRSTDGLLQQESFSGFAVAQKSTGII
jgi:hypothetical protein